MIKILLLIIFRQFALRFREFLNFRFQRNFTSGIRGDVEQKMIWGLDILIGVALQRGPHVIEHERRGSIPCISGHQKLAMNDEIEYFNNV
ncbi:hypothetical protein C8238_14310 [Paracidovorax avenae]|nr:hypothetical protein C8238_14310 [Paracidovorax avenae]